MRSNINYFSDCCFSIDNLDDLWVLDTFFSMHINILYTIKSNKMDIIIKYMYCVKVLIYFSLLLIHTFIFSI